MLARRGGASVSGGWRSLIHSAHAARGDAQWGSASVPDTMASAEPLRFREIARGAPGAPHAVRRQLDPAYGPLRTARVRHFEEMPGLAGAWNDVVDRCRSASVFQTFEWHRCWWESFGAGSELFLVLAFSGDRLVGIAPMMIGSADRPAPRGRVMQFIGAANHASDYCDFIVDSEFPAALEALLGAVYASGNATRAILLAHFRRDSPHYRLALEYLRCRRIPAHCDAQDLAPVRRLGDAESDRKAAGKTSLRRHTRYFEKNGTLRFHRCATADEVLRWLDRFFEQHLGRRALTDAPSQFGDAAQRDFYVRLVLALAPAGWLRFDIVLFDDAPIAFHLGFEYRGCFLWYKPTFDARLAAKSPGEVLIKFLLDDAIDRGLKEFDFTVGAEPFKLRFANATRTVDRVLAFLSPLDFWKHRLAIAARHLAGSSLRKLRCMLRTT